LIGQDRAAMGLLPPAAPAAGFTAAVRLPRDYYLRVLGNDYSIDPAVIGRMIDVSADLDTVTARCHGTLVARHPRSWGPASDHHRPGSCRRCRPAPGRLPARPQPQQRPGRSGCPARTSP
jgi:hypothetical protein